MEFGIAMIGFGEAGATFAKAARWGVRARAFDIADNRRPVMAALGVIPCQTPAEALAGAFLVLSLVTADQALAAARTYAPLLAPGALLCDMNSVAPGTKRAAAAAVAEAGARYVDVAVMAPVDPQRLAVPLLLAGPAAPQAREALAAAGFSSMRVVGDEVGRASTVKMLRSVMYKGMEALTAECLIACHQAGVTEDVLASFGGDWAGGADYRLDRMLVHGRRRAAELREVCATLTELGVDPAMSGATAAWEQALGELAIEPAPTGLAAKLRAIASAMEGNTKA